MVAEHVKTAISSEDSINMSAAKEWLSEAIIHKYKHVMHYS